MEPKKNPKYDVHKKSRMTFFFSLCVSFLLVLSAFQWKHPISKPDIQPQKDGVIYDPLYPVPITEITNTLPSKPSPIKEKTIPINPVEAKDDVFIDEPSIVFPADLPVEPLQVPTDFGEPEAVPNVFLVVEKMPIPTEGYEAFYKFLSKETKYPKAAIRSHVRGKVYVEFIVSKNGELTNLRVSKGVGYGCDEEALRVISLTKWKAGKQRGVPVNVKMTLPIYFNLK